MANTPELSSQQSLGQGSERSGSWAGSEKCLSKGLCSSLAVQQHKWACPTAFGQGYVNSCTSRSAQG